MLNSPNNICTRTGPSSRGDLGGEQILHRPSQTEADWGTYGMLNLAVSSVNSQLGLGVKSTLGDESSSKLPLRTRDNVCAITQEIYWFNGVHTRRSKPTQTVEQMSRPASSSLQIYCRNVLRLCGNRWLGKCLISNDSVRLDYVKITAIRGIIKGVSTLSCKRNTFASRSYASYVRASVGGRFQMCYL